MIAAGPFALPRTEKAMCSFSLRDGRARVCYESEYIYTDKRNMHGVVSLSVWSIKGGTVERAVVKVLQYPIRVDFKITGSIAPGALRTMLMYVNTQIHNRYEREERQQGECSLLLASGIYTLLAPTSQQNGVSFFLKRLDEVQIACMSVSVFFKQHHRPPMQGTCVRQRRLGWQDLLAEEESNLTGDTHGAANWKMNASDITVQCLDNIGYKYESHLKIQEKDILFKRFDKDLECDVLYVNASSLCVLGDAHPLQLFVKNAPSIPMLKKQFPNKYLIFNINPLYARISLVGLLRVCHRIHLPALPSR